MMITASQRQSNLRRQYPHKQRRYHHQQHQFSNQFYHHHHVIISSSRSCFSLSTFIRIALWFSLFFLLGMIGNNQYKVHYDLLFLHHPRSNENNSNYNSYVPHRHHTDFGTMEKLNINNKTMFSTTATSSNVDNNLNDFTASQKRRTNHQRTKQKHEQQNKNHSSLKYPFVVFGDDRIPKHNLIDRHNKRIPTSGRFAYAFLIGGIDWNSNSTTKDTLAMNSNATNHTSTNTGAFAYRGFLYNVLVASKLLRHTFRSTADVWLMLQINPTEKKPENTNNNHNSFEYDELPLEDQILLQSSYITHVWYLPPPSSSSSSSFSQTVYEKFRILEMTEYDRVMFLDADIMPVRNLDYLFDWTMNNTTSSDIILSNSSSKSKNDYNNTIHNQNDFSNKYFSKKDGSGEYNDEYNNDYHVNDEFDYVSDEPDLRILNHAAIHDDTRTNRKTITKEQNERITTKLSLRKTNNDKQRIEIDTDISNFTSSINESMNGHDPRIAFSNLISSQPNLILATRGEPCNAGLFILEPSKNAYNLIIKAIITRQLQDVIARNLSYPYFDRRKGWGHDFRHYEDEWRAILTTGKLWNYHASHSDQGLLYYYTKYYVQRVMIVIGDVIETWEPAITAISDNDDGNTAISVGQRDDIDSVDLYGTGHTMPIRTGTYQTPFLYNPTAVTTTTATIRRRKHRDECQEEYEKGFVQQDGTDNIRPRGYPFQCFLPYNDFAHFFGKRKPWQSDNHRVEKYVKDSQPSVVQYPSLWTSYEVWFYMLRNIILFDSKRIELTATNNTTTTTKTTIPTAMSTIIAEGIDVNDTHSYNNEIFLDWWISSQADYMKQSPLGYMATWGDSAQAVAAARSLSPATFS